MSDCKNSKLRPPNTQVRLYPRSPAGLPRPHTPAATATARLKSPASLSADATRDGGSVLEARSASFYRVSFLSVCNCL